MIQFLPTAAGCVMNLSSHTSPLHPLHFNGNTPEMRTATAPTNIAPGVRPNRNRQLLALSLVAAPCYQPPAPATASWAQTPKVSGSDVCAAVGLHPQYAPETRQRSAAVRWFSASQRCAPAMPDTQANSARVPRLQPTPAAYQQTSGVHNIATDARGPLDHALQFENQHEQKSRHYAPSPALPLLHTCSPKGALQTAALPHCRTSPYTRFIFSSSTCAARITSPCHRGAITPSSMHKCKNTCAIRPAPKRCTNSTPPVRCHSCARAHALCGAALRTRKFAPPCFGGRHPSVKSSATTSATPPPTAPLLQPKTRAPPCTYSARCTNVAPLAQIRNQKVLRALLTVRACKSVR